MKDNKKTFLTHDIISSASAVITLSTLYIYVFSIMSNATTSSEKAGHADTDYYSILLGIAFVIILIFTDLLLRYKCSNVLIYLGGHTLPLILPFIAQIHLYALIPLACIWFFVIYSAINYWKKEEIQKGTCAIEMPSELIIIYIGIFFHCYYGISKTSACIVYICGVVFFILSMLNRYFEKIIVNIQSALGSNKKVENSQYKINTFMIILFACFIFFICCGIGLVFFDTPFNIVGSFFKLIGSGIVAILMMFNNKGTVHSQPTEETPLLPNNQAAIQPLQKSNPLFEAMFNVLQVIVYCAIAFAIIYGIYFFLRSNMHKKKFDDPDDTPDESTDKVVKLKSKRKLRNIFTSMSNNEKIRKMYKNKINTIIKKNVNLAIKKSNTPHEIEHAINTVSNDSRDSVGDITALYEKARYSDKEITKEDVGYCKKL